jgi:hypothetical protein
MTLEEKNKLFFCTRYYLFLYVFKINYSSPNKLREVKQILTDVPVDVEHVKIDRKFLLI